MQDTGTPRPEDFPGLIRVMRFFVESKRYNIVDRLGFAQSQLAVEQAIYEALRTIRVLRGRAVRVELGGVGREGRTLTLTCLEYSDDEDDVRTCMGVRGRVNRVISGPGEELAGRTICCVPDSGDVSEDELRRFFEEVRKGEEGLLLAKEIAALAFARRSSSQSS